VDTYEEFGEHEINVMVRGTYLYSGVTNFNEETIMAWKTVDNYWLGYSIPKKSFYFYYALEEKL